MWCTLLASCGGSPPPALSPLGQVIEKVLVELRKPPSVYSWSFKEGEAKLKKWMTEVGKTHNSPHPPNSSGRAGTKSEKEVEVEKLVGILIDAEDAEKAERGRRSESTRRKERETAAKDKYMNSNMFSGRGKKGKRAGGERRVTGVCVWCTRMPVTGVSPITARCLARCSR